MKLLLEKHFSWVTGIIFLFFSCEFSPSEIPLTEIDEPSEIPLISIELLPEMDTLKLSEPVTVTYRVETGEYELHAIEMLFDEVEIPNLSYTSQNAVNAYINASTISDGLHEIKIRTYTSTNSGSIADKIGAEVFWYELSWPVLIDKQAKENFKINEVQVIPEGLKLGWSCYDYADFVSYRLSRYSRITGKYINFEITDPNQNSFVDNTGYIEGDYFSYLFYLNANDLRFFPFEYHEDIPAPLVSVNSDCTVDIRWQRSKYEKNVQGYYIRTAVPNYGSMEDHDLTNLDQTSYSLEEKIGFGGDYEVQLRYVPKGFEGYHIFQVGGGLTKFALGDSIPVFQKAFLLPGKNALLAFNAGTFMQYSISEENTISNFIAFPVEDVYLWTITCSPGGVLFGYFDGHDYVIRRTNDWSLVRKMDIKAYEGFNLSALSIAISDNGLLATTNYSNVLRIFDTFSGNQLLERTFTGYLPKISVSTDGKHICMLHNDYSTGIAFVYYSFSEDSGELTETGRVYNASDGSFMQFSPLGDKKLVVVRHTGMYDFITEERDENTFELIRSTAIAHAFVPIVYDFYSHRVIAQYQFFPTRDYSYLYDLQTGEQKTVVQFCSRTPLVFASGRVYASNGRSIYINDYTY